MTFGTYDATFHKLGSMYKQETKTPKKIFAGNRYEFFDRKTNHLKAFAEKGTRYDYTPQWVLDNRDSDEMDGGVPTKKACIGMVNYEFRIKQFLDSETKLNKFDYIKGENQHAVDLNGNNKVDSDEIFQGKLNYNAYMKAKYEGNLKLYSIYYNDK